MVRRLAVVAILAVSGLAAGIAAAAGPTPGLADSGVFTPNGQVRYVAVQHVKTTSIKAVRVDGRVLRSATLQGRFGVPLVAYDGTAGGLSHDGRLLVLETFGSSQSTRFAVLATRNLKVQQSFRLAGVWAYDALSPEGKTLYLIQILPAAETIRYLVRAYDLGLHRLVSGAIADKSEPGAMTGYPVSRVASTDGSWAYTLYQRPAAQPFIHALDTRDRVAICIDLAWKGDPSNLGNVRLTLSADEQQLVVRRVADGKALMAVPVPR